MVKQQNYIWLIVGITTKYMSTIIASCTHYSLHYSFYHVALVKLYCDVITRSCLQLINTSINTFLVNLAWNKEEEEGRPVMVKRKLDGAVDESSADQKICELDVTMQPVKNLEACT